MSTETSYMKLIDVQYQIIASGCSSSFISQGKKEADFCKRFSVVKRRWDEVYKNNINDWFFMPSFTKILNYWSAVARQFATEQAILVGPTAKSKILQNIATVDKAEKELQKTVMAKQESWSATLKYSAIGLGAIAVIYIVSKFKK